MKQDLRCPLGKSSNELVVVVYKGQVILLQPKIVQFLPKLIYFAFSSPGFDKITNSSCCALGLHL